MIEEKEERKGAKKDAKAQGKTRQNRNLVSVFLCVFLFFLCAFAFSSGVFLP
jgi:hypothetical protein